MGIFSHRLEVGSRFFLHPKVLKNGKLDSPSPSTSVIVWALGSETRGNSSNLGET